MNKEIKCPECKSSKIALSDAKNEYVNICTLLCFNCLHVFLFKQAIIEDNKDGNMKRLIKNLMTIGEKVKAKYFLRELTGMDKNAAGEYVDSLV